MHQLLKALDAINRCHSDEVFPPIYAVNKKTGKKYRVLATPINATNKHEDIFMVLYADTETGDLYVRQQQEFEEKFAFVRP